MVLSHASGTFVSPLLWLGLKYLNKNPADCHTFWYRHSLLEDGPDRPTNYDLIPLFVLIRECNHGDMVNIIQNDNTYNIC